MLTTICTTLGIEPNKMRNQLTFTLTKCLINALVFSILMYSYSLNNYLLPSPITYFTDLELFSVVQ